MFSTAVSEKTKNDVDTSGLTPLSKQSLVLFTLSFIAACFMFFTHLGDLPLFSPDEALYVEPAREMLESGEYITTYHNYQVRFTKPPLFIWAVAASLKTFATTEFAARFVSACCGAILVGLTFLFGNKFFGKRVGFLSALMLTLAPMYLAVSRLAITDIPLTLFMSGALMSLFYGFTTRESRWKWFGYILLGMAVMTKGPVAIVLPAVVLFCYHGLMGEIKSSWKYYNPFAGLAVIALIAVPWFAVEIWITKGAYFDAFIMRENLQRFTGVVDHKYPWWYHLVAMFGGFFPWSLLLPFAWFNAFKGDSKVEGNWLRKVREANPSIRAALFSTVCALAILGFFSISVSKLLPYTLPAFPFLAVVSAYFLVKLCQDKKVLPVCLALATVCISAVASYFFAPGLIEKLRDCPPDLVEFSKQGIIAIFFCGLIPLFMAMTKRLYASVVAFAVFMMATFAIIGPSIQNIFGEAWEQPLKSFAQYAGVSDKPIYLCNIRKPSATFYALRRVEREETIPQLWDRLKTVDSAYIIGRARHTDEYLKNKNVRLIEKQGKFVLVYFSRNKATESNTKKLELGLKSD